MQFFSMYEYGWAWWEHRYPHGSFQLKACITTFHLSLTYLYWVPWQSLNLGMKHPAPVKCKAHKPIQRKLPESDLHPCELWFECHQCIAHSFLSEAVFIFSLLQDAHVALIRRFQEHLQGDSHSNRHQYRSRAWTEHGCRHQSTWSRTFTVWICMTSNKEFSQSAKCVPANSSLPSMYPKDPSKRLTFCTTVTYRDLSLFKRVWRVKD